MRPESEGERSLKQTTGRQVMNGQAGGAEGTTWKLVVGQETQRALGKQGEAHI